MSKKILVIDDSKLMHRMYEMMLRKHTLLHAMDGLEGLQILSEQGRDVDLVLLDINMPRMNGLEFLAAKAEKGGGVEETPVIIISTKGREEDAERGLEAGADAYIRKPFKSTELLEIIERLEVG